MMTNQGWVGMEKREDSIVMTKTMTTLIKGCLQEDEVAQGAEECQAIEEEEVGI